MHKTGGLGLFGIVFCLYTLYRNRMMSAAAGAAMCMANMGNRHGVAESEKFNKIVISKTVQFIIVEVDRVHGHIGEQDVPAPSPEPPEGSPASSFLMDRAAQAMIGQSASPEPPAGSPTPSILMDRAAQALIGQRKSLEPSEGSPVPSVLMGRAAQALIGQSKSPEPHEG